VVGAIEPEIEKAEIERASQRPTGSIDAVAELYRGAPHVSWPTSPENNDKALQHFKNAIAIDPRYAQAYGLAATCLMWRRSNGWPADVADDDAQLLSYAERVRELRTDDANALSSLGFALFFNKVNFDVGIELVDRAIQSNPNSAPAYLARGYMRVWDGGSDAAVADFEKAIRLSPRGPLAYNALIGMAQGHYNAGSYIDAAKCADRFVANFPFFIAGLRAAILCYVGAGRLGDAQKVLGEILRLSPKLRLSTMPPGGFRSPELIRKVREALLTAGLPE
jgi:tetratricopeptide (TPR) repeat protein